MNLQYDNQYDMKSILLLLSVSGSTIKVIRHFFKNTLTIQNHPLEVATVKQTDPLLTIQNKTPSCFQYVLTSYSKWRDGVY